MPSNKLSRLQQWAWLYVSYIVIGGLTVVYWRGTWVLMDEYLYPDDTRKSGFASLFISLVGFLLASFPCFDLFCSQKSSDTIATSPTSSAEQSPAVTIILKYIYTFVLGFIAVNSWRGVWLLQDEYIIPDRRELSAWISLIVGTTMLIFVGHLQCILAPPAVVLPDSGDSSLAPFRILQPLNVWGRTIGTQSEYPQATAHGKEEFRGHEIKSNAGDTNIVTSVI
eukprot:m.82992 g.82992  ORF g.82992 m.82992 type:complete len:224 (-) comp12898_c0_seq2:71-742(-)